MITTEIRQSVELALSEIRPFLQNDGGDITLVEITEDHVVKVKLHGTCNTCSMKPMTMRAGVLETIRKALPEIKEVVEVENSDELI